MPTHLDCQLVLQDENENDLAAADPFPALAILQHQLAAAWRPCKKCKRVCVATPTYRVAGSALGDNNVRESLSRARNYVHYLLWAL